MTEFQIARSTKPIKASFADCCWHIGLALALFMAIVQESQADSSDGGFGSQAVPLFNCDFETDSDENYDLWPDGWTRRRGHGYPQYLEMGIIPKPAGRENEHCMSIAMDGGAAFISSPPVPIASRFSYAVELDIKVEGLHRDIISMLLTFLDENMQPLETVETKPVVSQKDWQHISIRPAAPHDLKTRFAVVSMHVRPGEREDLKGRLLLDQLQVLRLPQMVVRSVQPNPIYRRGEQAKVRVEISGIIVTDSTLTFELLDSSENLLSTHTISLGATKPDEQKKQREADEALATETWTPWDPTLPGPGFYYVRASLRDKEGNGLQRTVRLAVISDQPVPKEGEFGWSLPDSDRPLGISRLVNLLGHAGINWVKYPVWYGERETARAENIIRLSDQLDETGIQIIGMLDQPPSELAKQFGDQISTPTAIVFAEKNVWMPALDNVLTRLSLKVRWWQLGADDDMSFVGDPALPGKVKDVRNQLNRFGESMRLGIAWKSVHLPPEKYSQLANFLSYSDHPTPTAQEIMQNTSERMLGNAERWISLQPLKRGEYDHQTRARDLIERMLAARMKKYNLAFIPRPFDDDEGLFYSDGTPGELFLPWRTTALALAGRDYLGSLRLPQGSDNHLFSLGDEAVLVVWNDRPVKETVYLGENITALNMWGAPIEIPTVAEEDRSHQVLSVGPSPIFIFGVNAKLAQWCMNFDFESSQLQSLLGRDQTVPYKYQNFFAKSVTGSFTIYAPAIVENAAPVSFRAAPGEQRKSAFPLLLKPEAGSGARPVRIDFQLNADRNYRFSIYRNMVIGLQGMEVDLETRLTSDGFLEVRAHLANQTESPVSFQCHLFVPERRRDKVQVLNLSNERKTITFRVADGAEIIGKELVLRLEEIGGSRVMNQHLIAHE